MTDIEDKEFEKELADAFEIEETPATPPVADPKKDDPATPPATPKVEEPKKDDPAVSTDPNKKDEELEIPSTDPAKPTEEDPAKPKDPETPPATEAPAAPTPLTEEGVRKLLQEARTEERNSITEVKDATQTVMEAYYPDGLSNVLVDEKSGKELKTPQDVVDASGGEMSTEQAAQWLMNQQYELDQNIAKIQKQAENIAETTLNFKRDATIALQKYEPLFKAYPQLQTKAYTLMMKQVKIDEEKGVILQAPDVLDLYDTYLEPYQQAYEIANQAPATNPTPAPGAPAPATPPAKPGQADRLDENGDGGANTEVDDPNDFAQQVAKELAKGA
jgi:hypothetical protein